MKLVISQNGVLAAVNDGANRSVAEFANRDRIKTSGNQASTYTDHQNRLFDSLDGSDDRPSSMC